MPVRQTFGSSIVSFEAMKAPPMVETMKSTSLPGLAWMHFETSAISLALPGIILRLGVVDAGKIFSSLEGVRQSAMHWWPAASVCLSVERPTPVLAPKKATVLMVEVEVLMISELR